MPFWKVASVALQPAITLVRWSIIETDIGTRHFIGYCVENCEGRVSTAIKEFGPHALRGVTASGRCYQLSGRPGRDLDAYYVWDAWTLVNGVKSAREVTSEVVESSKPDGGATC